MNGKSFSLQVGAILDFCENVFHSFSPLKLEFLEMFRLFLCLHQLTLFGIDIAHYINGLIYNVDIMKGRYYLKLPIRGLCAQKCRDSPVEIKDLIRTTIQFKISQRWGDKHG